MAIEVNSSRAICNKCGTEYSRKKGFFSVSYSVSHKGTGYVPICRKCVDNMYSEYLAICHDQASAVRQVCRKLDIYWNKSLYELIGKKNTSRTIMTQYIAKTNTITYAGKSYDDTLLEEGTLWDFDGCVCKSENGDVIDANKATGIDTEEVPDEVIAFFGPDYTPAMYKKLNQRYQYWMSKFPESTKLDIGAEAIIRQICSIELDINRDRAAGKSIDKSVNVLNTLLGSLSLKPDQKKDDSELGLNNTPFGVWIKRWEDQRPIPEPDPEFKDVDGIVRYISIWFLGHLCKMLGIKNTHSKLYEEEIKRLKVERPEFNEEDDETVFNDIFSYRGQNSDGDE